MANGHGGKREGAGRPKGSVNALGLQVKKDIIEAFNDPRVGGMEWLVQLALNDKKTFAALLAKILPTVVEGEINHNMVDRIYQELTQGRSKDGETVRH